MIKIGCCLNMNARDNYKAGYDDIPVIAKLGFDYAELPLAQVMDLPREEFTDLLSVIKTNGIPVEACNNFFPARVRLTGSQASLDTILEYAKAAVDRAAQMGAKIIVLGSSGAKNIPDGYPYDKARGQLREITFLLNQTVKPFGITIALEPLNSKESNFITTAAEALEFAVKPPLENVKMLIDYYHLRMENENPAIVNRAGPYLRHLHIASKEGRLFPKYGDGENYADFFKRLKEINYNGRISVEGFTKDLEADGAASLDLLKKLAV
ncbi:MAG: sugar phosphate isomerase/epimerase [Treponema sp.]|nr:sugar phosphate isomerase/epimerase [Treponema sp.]